MGCSCTTDRNEFSEKLSENAWLTSQILELFRNLITQFYTENRLAVCKVLYIIYLYTRNTYNRLKTFRKLITQNNYNPTEVHTLLVGESEKLIRTRDVLRTHLAPASTTSFTNFDLVAAQFKEVRSQYREFKKSTELSSKIEELIEQESLELQDKLLLASVRAVTVCMYETYLAQLTADFFVINFPSK